MTTLKAPRHRARLFAYGYWILAFVAAFVAGSCAAGDPMQAQDKAARQAASDVARVHTYYDMHHNVACYWMESDGYNSHNLTLSCVALSVQVKP